MFLIFFNKFEKNSLCTFINREGVEHIPPQTPGGGGPDSTETGKISDVGKNIFTSGSEKLDRASTLNEKNDINSEAFLTIGKVLRQAYPGGEVSLQIDQQGRIIALIDRKEGVGESPGDNNEVEVRHYGIFIPHRGDNGRIMNVELIDAPLPPAWQKDNNIFVYQFLESDVRQINQALML